MKKSEVIKSKIYTTENLTRLLAIWRFKNKKIVFTNGCFDLIHRGHVEYLAGAAELGNILIVGVNSDRSVRTQGKGPSRPIQDETSRALILAAMHVVDAVIIFDEDTPYELIRLIMPDVLVKGGDWQPEKIAGYDIVTANGGIVTSIAFVEGYSTSLIEKKIKEG